MASDLRYQRSAEAKSRSWIPKSAVVRQGNETYVYLAAEGAAVLRKIKTGAEGAKGVEVTEGLAGTEQVIVEPLDQLRDGARITLAP